MKLDQKQVEEIETVLENSGVVYVDYKFEILDHIATEVEHVMEEFDESFEKSLAYVLKKWRPQFKKASSRWFGYFWELPVILKKKCVKIYKKNMLLFLGLSISLSMIILLLSRFLIDYVHEILTVMQVFFLAVLVIQIIGFIKIYKSKAKTSYEFLYKQKALSSSLLYVHQFFFLTSNHENYAIEKGMNYIIILYFSLLLLLPFLLFKYYKAHFKELEKLEIIKI